MTQRRVDNLATVITAERGAAGARESVATPLRSSVAATIATADGRPISGGTVELVGGGGTWTAAMRHLDQPGALAMLYFAEGLREVRLTLDDGRSARARIRRTRFAGSERVCELAGMEPLC